MPLETALGDAPERLKNYRTENLRVGFRRVMEVKANWKLWHENFTECFHCPENHPELCAIVPIYASGLLQAQGPEWEPSGGDTYSARIGYDIVEGARTWTMDGQLSGPPLSSLSDDEQNLPNIGMLTRPSFFFNGHPDYVHTHRLLPTGPTTLQLTWDYLFEPSTMERDDFDAKRGYELWDITNLQDAQNVEWQQAGLMTGRAVHKHSVFVPQETGPDRINQWVAEVMETSD